MDKHEARLKCSGCGSSYKLKVPVTDKAVSFQCKKCGKMLKVRVKPPDGDSEPVAAAAASKPAKKAAEESQLPGLETTQLPDLGEFDDDMPSFEDDLAAPAAKTAPAKTAKTQAPPPPPADSPDAEGPPEFDDDFASLGPPSFDDDFATSDPTMQALDPDRLHEQADELERLRKQREEELARKRAQAREADYKEDAGPMIETGYDAQINPDDTPGHRPGGPSLKKAGPEDGRPSVQAPAQAAAAAPADKDKRWMVLANEQVLGPFADQEIVAMINEGEIDEETPLRMGQRPWIKVSQIGDFRKFFVRGTPSAPATPLASISLLAKPPAETAKPTGPAFYTQWGEVLPYPIRGGNWQPLAIFFGIAFVFSTVLSLVFLPGLVLSIAGWVLLYGYLGQVMAKSVEASQAPPPPWDFGKIAELLSGGSQVFLVLLVYSLVPVTVCVLVMVIGFLNYNDTLGWVFLAATVVVYAGTLFVAPAALAVLGKSKALASALNPLKAIKVITQGSRSYLMLGAVSIGLGLICMAGVLLAVFLAEIPAVGFVVAGLVMALLMSYAHFVWFHVLGRFVRETPVVGQV